MMSKNKILLVDDDEDFRRLLVKKIEREFPDYRVSEASDGMSGLQKLNSEPYSLMILDFNMPIVDGFEVLVHMRRNPNIANTPVVMCTANSTREDVVKILQMGVIGYIVKSIETEKMMNRLKELIFKVENTTAKLVTKSA